MPSSSTMWAYTLLSFCCSCWDTQCSSSKSGTFLTVVESNTGSISARSHKSFRAGPGRSEDGAACGRRTTEPSFSAELRRLLRPCICPQKILGVAVAFQGAHVHVTFAGELAAHGISGSNKGVQ